MTLSATIPGLWGIAEQYCGIELQTTMTTTQVI
jgi:hypothetical protein